MELTQQILTVTVLLGTLCGGLWWLQRRGIGRLTGRTGPKAHKRLERIERLALTPQHSLHVVRYAGREILVGVSPSGCVLLKGGARSTLTEVPTSSAEPSAHTLSTLPRRTAL